MVRTKKHGTNRDSRDTTSDVEPPRRELRTRGARRKVTDSEMPEENGADADHEPPSLSLPTSSETTAPRKTRATRATSRTLSQPPANTPQKKSVSKPSKKTGLESATESADEVDGSSTRPSPLRRRRLNNAFNADSSAEAEDAELSSANFRHLDNQSNVTSSVEDADISSSRPSVQERQRLGTSSAEVETIILDPTITVDNIPGIKSSSASSNQPNYPYPSYEEPPAAIDPEDRPKWTEPSLAPSLEDQLGKRPNHEYDYYQKLEFNMERESDMVYDVLREDRKLLTRTAPTRGRGRGRGRGGRGRGKSINNRPLPESAEIQIATVQTRGRGGYRVKKSENPRIQALYHRRAALRNQYRAVANFQRAALEALGEKSVELLIKDPEAHTRLPAFDQTGEKLGQLFEKTIRESNARLRIHGDFLIKKKLQDEEYARRLQEFASQDEDDEIFTEILETFNHLAKQKAFGASEAQVPFRPLDEGFPIKRIQKPKKVVALEGTPFGTPGDWPATIGEHVGTVGDTELEQHPANFKRSIHPEDRMKFQQDLLRQREESSAAKGKKRGAPRTSKSLLAPSAALANVPLAPTPGEVSEAEQVAQDNDETSTDGDVGPMDALDNYGVKLPNKPTPKNGMPPSNRFVVNPHFQYEDYEIGNRAQKNKRTNTGESQYVGKDANPNPKTFHFDQRATGQYNSARNKLGDLDEELVALHGLHPVYGLALPGCRNPTREEYQEEFKSRPGGNHNLVKPRTNWSEPLKPTQPVYFIEEDPNSSITDDRFKRFYRTSRSEHHIRNQQIFNEQFAKTNIQKIIKEFLPQYQGIVLNASVPVIAVEATPPSTSGKGKEDVVDSEVSLMPFLVEAAREARKLLTAEEVAKAKVRLVQSHFRRYDPVRDQFTTTSPYTAPIPPTHEDRTRLNALANIAETSRSAPSIPPSYHPAPPPWAVASHQPAGYAHPHGHPQSQPQQMQQARPQAGSSLRQLLPAPPQGPAPPPAQYRY